MFGSNAKKKYIPITPDTEIIFYRTPYISYQQIMLVENFGVHIKSTLRPKKCFRSGIKMTPYQKSFEVNTRIQDIKVNFMGTNR